MTPSQMRAMRAKQLLDSGRDAKEVAKELGYTKVSAMLGAISLCSRAIEREEKKVAEICKEEFPRTSPIAHLYPVENGIVTIGKELCSVTYKPDVGTAFINLKAYHKYLPLYNNLLGGKEGMAAVLRQIAEAATEAAALIEEEDYVDHHE